MELEGATSKDKLALGCIAICKSDAVALSPTRTVHANAVCGTATSSAMATESVAGLMVTGSADCNVRVELFCQLQIFKSLGSRSKLIYRAFAG